LNKIVRKLTTKPVWWLETRRPYPIRNAWTRLPAIPAQNGSIPFAVLTTPQNFNDALWTAWSWVRFLGDTVRLEVYVDGTLHDEMRRSLDQILPGSGLFEATPAIMANGNYPPHVQSFITDNMTGRKLGLLLALSRRGRFLFSDADILAFAKPTELMELFTSPEKGAYFLEETCSNFVDGIVARAARIGVTPPASLNCGLVLIPHNALSPEIANELLQGWQTPPINWVIEQTVTACLMSAAPLVALPRDRYVLSTARQFYWQPDVDYAKIVARHFTGTTRHVMYLKGMPWILKNLSKS